MAAFACRSLLRCCAALAALSASPAVATAPCAMELILALDVSGSVDAADWALQRDGIAGAFRDPVVLAAIEALPGHLLVTVTQWAGVPEQAQVTSWHRVADAGSAARFADAVAALERLSTGSSTAIGQALIHAGTVGRTAPARCARRVIDISGDGVSNEGIDPGGETAALVRSGYVVNGLVVRDARQDATGFYELEVIGGRGSFVEVAEGFADLPRAFKRKLLRELGSELVIGALE